MNRLQIKSLILTATTIAGVSWGSMHTASAGYLQDSQEKIVVNDYQECWQVLDPSPGLLAMCGDIIDSDGDGVPDDRDKCPDTPAGVKVNEDGCPEDSDGDGVPDYRDKCPGTPPGAAVDKDGCPSDDDNDGVPNHRDKCPNTRAGARVDKDGCEIIDSLVLDIVSDGFDFDKSTIKPHMTSDLNSLAERIKASPGNESIDIVGHTDSIGTDAYNQSLSNRRASSVASYLGKQGVDQNRMKTSGKGEAEPVADNRTSEGRKRNRRVEIHTR